MRTRTVLGLVKYADKTKSRECKQTELYKKIFREKMMLYGYVKYLLKPDENSL